ncbi:MAG TPA: hypothetical protein VFZ79_08660 [Acidimicrobiales bacterium]
MATLGVAASGCADEGDIDVGGTETTEQPGPTGADPRSESDLRVDEKAAEAMLPTLADLPPGWEQSAAPEEDVQNEAYEEVRSELASCLGVELAELDPDNPSATSPELTSAADEAISVEVAFTPSPEAAHRAFEILDDDAAPPLLRRGGAGGDRGRRGSPGPPRGC